MFHNSHYDQFGSNALETRHLGNLDAETFYLNAERYQDEGKPASGDCLMRPFEALGP